MREAATGVCVRTGEARRAAEEDAADCEACGLAGTSCSEDLPENTRSAKALVTRSLRGLVTCGVDVVAGGDVGANAYLLPS